MTDPLFESFTDLDWKYYYCNILQDEEENALSQRAFTEYLASFSNYKAVKAIRDARDEERMLKELGIEKTDTNKTVSTEDDKEFLSFVERKFGKKING